MAFLRLKLRADNRTCIREVLGDDKFELPYHVGTALAYDEVVELALRLTAPTEVE